VEASIVSTMILKEMDVPEVFSRAVSHSHAEILKKVGADYVVEAEKEMGERLANIALNRSIKKYVEPIEGLGIAEVPTSPEMHLQSLADSEFRNKYGVTVLAIVRSEDGGAPTFLLMPKAATIIQEGDRLLVAGREDDLQKIHTVPEAGA
jgi:trk system potassium uptake protein TrkA